MDAHAKNFSLLHYSPRHWERLSEEIKVNPSIFKTVIDRFTNELRSVAQTERDLLQSDGWSTQVVDKVVAHIVRSSSRTRDRFAHPG